MPLDGEPGERDLLQNNKYPKVISIPNSVSVIDDFLQVGKALIDKKATGIYNVTNEGTINHQEILDMYKEIVDPSYNYDFSR